MSRYSNMAITSSAGIPSPSRMVRAMAARPHAEKLDSDACRNAPPCCPASKSSNGSVIRIQVPKVSLRQCWR